MRTLILAATVLTILGSGCASEIRYVPVPLPLPARPHLPAIDAGELKDLSDTTHTKLRQRDARRRQYAEELEAIICATHRERSDERCR